jgi:hypothetical protein
LQSTKPCIIPKGCILPRLAVIAKRFDVGKTPPPLSPAYSCRMEFGEKAAAAQ